MMRNQKRKSVNLLGWYSNGAELTARLVQLLEQSGVLVGSRRGFAMLVVYRGIAYSLCDNGGELNVEPCGDADGLRSIPTTASIGPALTLETIAYRVLCALNDERVDYERNEPGERIY